MKFWNAMNSYIIKKNVSEYGVTNYLIELSCHHTEIFQKIRWDSRPNFLNKILDIKITNLEMHYSPGLSKFLLYSMISTCNGFKYRMTLECHDVTEMRHLLEWYA